MGRPCASTAGSLTRERARRQYVSVIAFAVEDDLPGFETDSEHFLRRQSMPHQSSMGNITRSATAPAVVFVPSGSEFGHAVRCLAAGPRRAASPAVFSR
jgi:hypothetical protein